MTRAGRARTAGAVALVLALVAACSTAAEPVAPRTPAPVRDAWPGCDGVGGFGEDPGRTPARVGGVPTGFVPTAVVLCEQDQRTNARGDLVTVDLERTAAELGGLLPYLAQSDEPPSDGPCTLDLWLPPWLFLLDADGRFVAPDIPVDGCRKPLGWNGDRDRLPWETLPYTERVVREGAVVESGEARRAGCDMADKDVVDAYATSSHRTPGTFTRDPFAGRAVTVCVYEVPAADRGADAPPGDFVSGRSVDDGARSALAATLVAAPDTSAGCRAANASFAVVRPATGGPNLYAELDGCRRVVTDADATPVVRARADLLDLLDT